MSPTTAPTVTPDAIMQLAQGFMASKLLFVASEIKLFEQLADGPRSVEEIAAALGLPVRSLAVVANAMAAVGILTVEGGRYRNSNVAQTFLAGSGPADMRPFLTLLERQVYPSWSQMADAVRADARKMAILEFSPSDQAIFSAGVEAVTTGGAMALASIYDFARHRRLLDIGGGTGSFLKIIGNHHPYLELTLFEQPNAIAFARSRFTPADTARIKTIAGNILTDTLPNGFDSMLLSHVIHCLDVEQNRSLLKRSHEAAVPGGRLLIVEFLLDDTKTAPVAGALMSAEFLIRTNGVSYSATEIRTWAESAGWRFVEQRPLAGPVGAMVFES